MTEYIVNSINAHGTAGLFCLIGVFAYIGLITIGGGQVGITVMQQVMVDQFHLLDNDKFFNMVAISESTPGPIGINMATYIGTELYGVFGGVITTIGEVLPSLVIIILIARFFGKFSEKAGVKAAFSTLRPAVSGVIAVAAGKIIIISLITVLPLFVASDITTWNKGLVVSLPNLLFFVVTLVTLLKTKVHPVFIVFAGALFGIVFC